MVFGMPHAIMFTVTADHMRGRLSGIYLAQVSGAPVLGDLEAGGVEGHCHRLEPPSR